VLIQLFKGIHILHIRKNLLIAMATDERPHIHQLALRCVLAARSSKNETDTLTCRVAKVSLLNFEAQDYTELFS